MGYPKKCKLTPVTASYITQKKIENILIHFKTQLYNMKYSLHIITAKYKNVKSHIISKNMTM